MADVIAQYQQWKQQGESLKAQAKRAMETRFRELLSEAVRIAEEYRVDFGVPLKPSLPVTSFKYKASAKAKAKKASKPSVKPAPKNEPKKAEEHRPEVARLQRRLETAKKKLAEAKAAGQPTRPLEDRVYEIEDALKLAAQPA